MKVDTAEFIRAAHDPGDFLRDGRPEIAFVGRSNVGKSTLLNRVLGRKSLARISSTPGRTRAVNYFSVNSRVLFVDLPGYGYAKASKREREQWGRLIDRYFEQSENRIHVIQLIDAKVGATPLDVQAFDFLDAKGFRPTLVATKVDKVGRSKRHAALASIRRTLELDPAAEIVAFSSRSGEGLGPLWREINVFIDQPLETPTHPQGSRSA